MNCKPGDLARVVSNGGPMDTPGLVDRVVEIVKPAVWDEVFVSVCGANRCRFSGDTSAAWVVRSASPLPWMSTKRRVVFFYGERVVADSHLRPLGGVPVNDEVKDEVPA